MATADLYDYYPSYLDEYMGGSAGATAVHTRQMYSNDLPPEYFNAFGFAAFPQSSSMPSSYSGISLFSTIGGFLSSSVSALYSIPKSGIEWIAEPISNLATTIITLTTSTSDKGVRTTTSTAISNNSPPRPLESITIPASPKAHQRSQQSSPTGASSANNSPSAYKTSSQVSTSPRSKTPEASPRSVKPVSSAPTSSSSHRTVQTTSPRSNNLYADADFDAPVPISSSRRHDKSNNQDGGENEEDEYAENSSPRAPDNPNFDLDYAMYGNSGYDSYGISTGPTPGSSSGANSSGQVKQAEKIQYTSNPLAKKSPPKEQEREGSIIEYISNPMFRGPPGHLSGATSSSIASGGKTKESGMRSYMREQEKMSGYKSKSKVSPRK